MGTDLDCEQDAAAYVLGALDDVAAAAFRRHMADCAACREEVDLLESAATALPLMVPQYHPPAALRDPVMDEARRDLRRPAPGPSTTRKPTQTRLARPVPKPMLVGLGGLLVLAVITLVLTRRPSGPQYFPGRTAWSSAIAAVELSGDRGALLVKGIPEPPAGKVYEVWVEHGRDVPMATDVLFDVNARGEAAVDIPERLSNGDAVLVTEERTGGTLVPTLPAVIVAPVG